MTDTLSPPVPPSLEPRPRRLDRRVLADAVAAAVGAAVLGLLVVTAATALLWWAEDRSGTAFADAVRAGGQVWAVAHGGSLDAGHGTVGLTPLGLVLLPLALCRRAGRRVARAHPTARRVVVAAIALPYAALAGVLAAVTSSPSLRPDPVTTVLGALLVAAVGAAAGCGATRSLPRWLPHRLRPGLRAGAVSGLALAAASALLVALGLVLDAGTAKNLAGASEPGAVGGLGLLLLGAALVPNAVVHGAAWLAGPGFEVGAGTAVSPFATELGAVPALPLLAALPAAPPPGWAPLVLLVPVLAGVLAARLVLPPEDLRRSAPDALVCGLAVGVLGAAAAVLAGGPLGGGHLAEIGPVPWRVGLALAAEVAVGALAGAALGRRAR